MISPVRNNKPSELLNVSYFNGNALFLKKKRSDINSESFHLKLYVTFATRSVIISLTVSSISSSIFE